MVVELQLGEKVAKPVTTVQDWVQTFASVKPLDIFKEKSGHLQTCLWQHNRSKKPKHDFLNLAG